VHPISSFWKKPADEGARHAPHLAGLKGRGWPLSRELEIDVMAHMHVVWSTSQAPGQSLRAVSAATRSPAVRRADASSGRDRIVPAAVV
jgi:hypothetical protein